jgi:hypothetical protein
MSSNAPSGADFDPCCPWNSSYIDDDAEELLEPQACVDCGKDAHPESQDAERCPGCEYWTWMEVDAIFNSERTNEAVAKWERLAR